MLDFAAAEANLQRFVERSSDKPAVYGVLADFYQQRLRFGDAVAALVRQAEVAERLQVTVDRGQSTARLDSRLRGNDGQGADGTSALPGRLRYRAVQRAIGLIETRRLSAPDSLDLRRRLLEWYPEEPLTYQELLTALLQRKQHREALTLLERYREQFPRDPEYALHTQARLLEAQGNLDGALEVGGRAAQRQQLDAFVRQERAAGQPEVERVILLIAPRGRQRANQVLEVVLVAAAAHAHEVRVDADPHRAPALRAAPARSSTRVTWRHASSGV